MAEGVVVFLGRTPTGLRLRCTVCGEEFDATCGTCAEEFAAAHQAAHQDAHYGLGDLVAIGIKRLIGIKPCPACQRRQAKLNRVAPRVWRR
jgi:hypothetical protein